MIDPTSGAVTIDKLRFVPGSSIDMAMRAANAKVMDHGNGWCCVEVSDETHVTSLYYNEGKLSRLSLIEKSNHCEGWDNWDEARERQLAQRYAIVLKNIFGESEGTATWGRYSSGYDSKGGFSSIWLSYD